MTARLAIPDPHGPRPSVLTDEQLLQRYAAGQQDAADELFQRYQQPAFRLAFHFLRNEADALDAVQEGFMKALVSLSGFERRSSFQTWLLRIVRHVALNNGRKRMRRNRLFDRIIHKEELTSPCLIGDQRTPLHDVIELEEQERKKAQIAAIYRILMTRASIQMRVVFWKRMEGWSFQQIAENLGRCERTVRTYHAKVCAYLLQELEVLG